jgi:hypothetical protein
MTTRTWGDDVEAPTAAEVSRDAPKNTVTNVKTPNTSAEIREGACGDNLMCHDLHTQDVGPVQRLASGHPTRTLVRRRVGATDA